MVQFEVHIFLAPIPARDSDSEAWADENMQTAAKAAMDGAKPLRGPVEVQLMIHYPPSS